MIQMLSTYIESLRSDERGQGMVEYGLILALVSVVAILTLTAVGDALDPIFTSVSTALTGAL